MIPDPVPLTCAVLGPLTDRSNAASLLPLVSANAPTLVKVGDRPATQLSFWSTTAPTELFTVNFGSAYGFARLNTAASDGPTPRISRFFAPLVTKPTTSVCPPARFVRTERLEIRLNPPTVSVAP